MRFFSTLLAVCSLPLFVSAQPVITSAEDFEVGTVLVFKPCQAAGVTAGPAGAVQAWDFSTLDTLAGRSTEHMVSAAGTAHAAQFPDATMAEQYDDGTWVYFSKTAEGNFLHGFADDGQSLAIAYPTPIYFAKRPIQYLDSDTRPYTTRYAVGGSSLRGAGTVTIKADAYGTLTLPNDSFPNVLRVRIEERQTDTVQGSGMLIPIHTVSYTWFDAAHRSALLKIDSAITSFGTDVSVEYLLSETDAPAATTPLLKTAFAASPNPASSSVTLLCPEAGVLEVLDATGRCVQRQAVEAGRMLISVEGWKPGLYVARLASGGRVWQVRVGVE